MVDRAMLVELVFLLQWVVCALIEHVPKGYHVGCMFEDINHTGTEHSDALNFCVAPHEMDDQTCANKCHTAILIHTLKQFKQITFYHNTFLHLYYSIHMALILHNTCNQKQLFVYTLNMNISRSFEALSVCKIVLKQQKHNNIIFELRHSHVTRI